MLSIAFALACFLLVFLATRLFIIWLLRRQVRSTPDMTAKPENHDSFVIKPYIQLGDNHKQAERENLDLIWFTKDRDHLWAVEVKSADAKRWIQPERAREERITIDSIKPLRKLQVHLSNLVPGVAFDYRVLKDGNIVFSAQATARKSASQSYRFVAVGDLASGTAGAKKVAYQMWLAKPDLVLIPGDHVYKYGRLSEYLDHYYPIYNRDKGQPHQGGPLLRSTPFVVAFGNHDAGTPDTWDVRDLDQMPDLLAFFVVLSQPLNGPLATAGSANTPDLHGAKHRKEDFLTAAGKNFPRIANFSFDYGNAHWLVLDGNNYMDWTNPELRAWVEQDLAQAKSTWKFVAFHQPAFSSDIKHHDEQRMRLLVDIFQRRGVDVVFSGHNHAYERNYPLSFTRTLQPDGSEMSVEGRVSGEFVLDKTFDGKTNTSPHGIVYLVTGGGGGKLSLEPTRRADHGHLPPFTFKLVDDIHSFTVCDLSNTTLTVRQISEDGQELDSFTITK